MKLWCRHFDELTADELYRILALRVSVFVVEQQCPYQELDERDRNCWHIWLEDGGEIQAYARVLDKGASFPEASIGRVIAVKRRQGLGTRIVKEAIRVAEERYGAGAITIEAQTYARGLYEKLGFFQTSEEFLEDGIPHIQMRLVCGE